MPGYKRKSSSSGRTSPSGFRDFQQDGDLTICVSATEDIKGAADIVKRIHRAGRLPQKLGVGLDPYAISALVDDLAARKIEGDMITGIRQGLHNDG
jgi:phage terminase large subunit-like protein